MTDDFRIIYKSAELHKGRWFGKVAYVQNGKPQIVLAREGWPTRDEALAEAKSMEQELVAQVCEHGTPLLSDF